jgi:hypothetical protein
MIANEFKDCPFCGGKPYFDGCVDDRRDEGRYVQLSLVCCVTMTEAIGWKKAISMTTKEKETTLREKLISQWNTRFVEDSQDQ